MVWKNRNMSVGVRLKTNACRFCALKSDLSANAQVGVRDELRLLVAVLLLFQEGVQHAHGDAGQGHHEAQDLPGLSWRRRNIEEFNLADTQQTKTLPQNMNECHHLIFSHGIMLREVQEK